MKIVIYGASEFGYLIANEFYQQHDVVVIDFEENKTDEFDKLDISYISGSAADINVLKQANAKSEDVFIACTPNDEANIVACGVAKRLSKAKTICFVSKEEYKRTFTALRDIADAPFATAIDSVIWPEELLTEEIFRIVTVANALDVENFARGKAKLLEYKIEANSILVDKKVRDCKFPADTLIVGLTREGELFVPYGETILKEDDKAIFMGSSHSLDVLAGKFFHDKDVTRTVTIIGGGNVGLMLAKDLETLKIKVKIIEKNPKRCEYLSEVLSNALVLNGDGTNLELLNEEDIAESDVLISVTNNDEKNLLCSLLAKRLGVKRVISRVIKIFNIPLFEQVGIDIAVSTKFAALHEIKNEFSEKNIGILATVEQGKGEVLDIVIPENFETKKLMEIKLPTRAVVGIVSRKKRVIIPKGDTLIMPKDEIIVFTKNEDAQKIRDFFKK
ncbi:Trk system potassium transporter TrkA [bacterium]|nr:Trk system potassium transporter TrkA [bacterium]